jgi:hypothetical protein
METNNRRFFTLTSSGKDRESTWLTGQSGINLRFPHKLLEWRRPRASTACTGPLSTRKPPFWRTGP